MSLKTYENWVSTSTYPLINTFDDSSSNKDADLIIEPDKKNVVKFINEYRKLFNKGTEVRELKVKAKEELGEDLYLMLELDSFFKALRVKQKLNPETAESYFDEYISEMHNIRILSTERVKAVTEILYCQAPNLWSKVKVSFWQFFSGITFAIGAGGA